MGGDDFDGGVDLRVTDDDGLSSTATAEILIQNVAPTVDAGSDKTVYSGETVFFEGSFSDPGWLDAHTAVWNYSSEGPVTVGELTEEYDAPDSTGKVIGSYTYFRAGTYTVTLNVTDDEGGMGFDTLTVTVERIPVPIDIKPGSDSNPINPESRGVIPVAILNQSDWTPMYVDPALVNISTVTFGPGEADPVHWAFEDVDGDGDNDLILHFKTQDTGVSEDDSSCTYLQTSRTDVR